MEDLAEMDLPTELLRPVIQNMKIIFTVIFALIFIENGVSCLNLSEYAKFRGIRAIVVFVLWFFVPSYHRAFVVVQNFSSRAFRWCKICSRGYFVDPKFFLFRYFVGPKFFLVSISWVQNIFPWLFFGSEIVSHVYFAGPTFFMVSISWVRNFCVRAFCGFKIFSRGHLWGP